MPKTSSIAAAASQWRGETKELPRTALHFRSECKFDQAAPDAGTKDGQTVPFTMTARTGEAIEHWYWGRVIHDMSGMTLAKPTLPVDYCHDPDEILGFADKFSTDTGDLVVSGALTPFDPEDGDDRASEVIYKQKLGVPYEASIDFSGGAPVIEYVPGGASVDVNGGQFEGPGVVIRQWSLRGLAICPYGADPNTSTEFAGGDKVSVKFKGESMPENGKNGSTEQPAAAPAGAQQQTEQRLGHKPGEQTTPPAEVKPEQKFIEAFGDAGARWFLEGKSFESCASEFIAQLNKSHKDELDVRQAQFDQAKKDLETQLAAANSKLAAIGRGDAGVTFSNGEGDNADPKAAKLAQNLGDNLGRFAASMKLPGQKK